MSVYYCLVFMASVGARYMCLVGPVILFVNMHVLKVFYEQINE